MQSQFIAAINQLCDEKNLPREKVIETIESAFRAAYRKDYGNKNQEIEVTLDENSGDATVYLFKNDVSKVEDQDIETAAQRIFTLYENPEIYEKVVGNGRIFARQFRSEVVGKQILDVYVALVRN